MKWFNASILALIACIGFSASAKAEGPFWVYCYAEDYPNKKHFVSRLFPVSTMDYDLPKGSKFRAEMRWRVYLAETSLIDINKHKVTCATLETRTSAAESFDRYRQETSRRQMEFVEVAWPPM